MVHWAGKTVVGAARRSIGTVVDSVELLCGVSLDERLVLHGRWLRHVLKAGEVYQTHTHAPECDAKRCPGTRTSWM